MHDITTTSLKVSSAAFTDGSTIPQQFTCDGKNISPPLHIDELPEHTKSMVVIVEDPDAPRGTWTHWVVWNIQPTHDIPENTVPGIQGLNDSRKTDYDGPCPPSGTHRYYFKVYALDRKLTLAPRSAKQDVEKAMKDHIIAFGEIMGRYARK